MRALAAFEAEPPPVMPTDVVSIALSCALGYLDWRKPVPWREDHPRLAQWLDAFAAREPAFKATEAPA
jgi:glutathione S-transferase